MGITKSDLWPAMRRCHEARHTAGNRVQSVGLAWHTEEIPGRPIFVFHGGGTGGYNSLVGFTQEGGKPSVGIVVFANSAPGAQGMAANDVAVQILAALRKPRD
jgi:hypothetical protein